MKFLNIFWAFRKPVQDAYVSCLVNLCGGFMSTSCGPVSNPKFGVRWYSQSEVHSVGGAGLNATSKQWRLLNKDVSVKCLTVILGIGMDRLLGTCRGRVDMRFRCFGSAPCFLVQVDFAMLLDAFGIAVRLRNLIHVAR